MADRRAVIAVAAMFLLNGALFGMWAGRIPAFVDTFALSERDLGLLLVCLGGGAVLSFPLAGVGSDRVGAAQLTRRVAVAYVAALCVLPLMPSVWWLALALAAFGAGHGAMDVAMNGWAAEVEARARRPLMSRFHAMYSIGAGVGAFAGFGAVRAGLTPLAQFWIVGLALAALCLCAARVPWASARRAGGSVAFAIPSKVLLPVGLIGLAAGMGEGAIADWGAVFLGEVKGADPAEAALGFAAFSVGMVATRLAGDGIVARLGPKLAARLAGLTCIAGLAVLLAPGGLPLALTGFTLAGIGYAVLMPLVFSRAANDAQTPPGRAIAGVCTLGYGGMLMGPPLIGLIASLTSLPVAFAWLAILALIVLAAAGSLALPVARTAPA